jgi:TetR/AcrR family transcriptional regulator
MQVSPASSAARTVPDAIAVRIDEAPRIFAELGYEATTMGVLAKRIGVARATLYYYFPTKRDILVFAFLRQVHVLAQKVQPYVEAEGPSLRRLTEVVRELFAFTSSNPYFLLFVTTDLGRTGAIREIADALISEFHSPVARIVRDGIADGTIRAIDESVLVATLFGATVNVAAHCAMFGSDLTQTDAIDGVTAVLLSGLATVEIGTSIINQGH